jgi:DNA-binding NarL/FixJ family response regulator
MKPTTFWIIDDHASFRNSLRRGVESTGRHLCTGSFPSAESALRAALVHPHPMAVIVDLGLRGMSGADAIPLLAKRMPGAAFMMLTVFDDAYAIRRALCMGAQGYLLKSIPAETVAKALDELTCGGSPIAAKAGRRLVEMFRSLIPSPGEFGLTSREKEILGQMVAGHIKKEIAGLMGLSIHTVNSHMRSIYRKLNVRTINAAVARALKSQLV